MKAIPLFALIVVCAGADFRSREKTWEKEIQGIEARITKSDQPKGGIVFAGSSSTRLWDLKKSFPDWNATNCGFGGSQIRDSSAFFARIILPLKPKAVVLYAGDNDVNSKRAPEMIYEDFITFQNILHASLPECQLYFICIKPSVARWNQFETQSKVNLLIREYCEKEPRLTYVDVVPGMLMDGKPDPNLFVKDGLHMSPKGYEIWTAKLREAMKSGK
ncbi:MAG: GDSL-type esterase/lipase family protein [Zavarzinella sp.]